MTAAITPRVLRDYQTDAVAAVEREWERGVARTAVVLPTGAGKSTVIGRLAVDAYHRGERVVMLAHRGELLDQLVDAVHAVDPSLHSQTGIVRAEIDESHQPIVAASLQTLARPDRVERLGRRDATMFDEVHHVSAGTYLDVVTRLGAFDGARFAGFTATLRREDGRALREVIESVAFERDLRWAIREGFLVQPRGLTVRIPDLDKLTTVRTVAGDFANKELAEVMEASVESTVDAIERFASDRSPIVFAASVVAAELISDALNARGYPAEWVTGATPYEQRKDTYGRYRRGETRALVTVQVLTEGADFPMCDAAVIARPTQSQVLYSQMVGRSLRPYPGKSDALVLDLSGTTRVLRLVTLSDLDAGGSVRVVDPDGNEIVDPDESLDDEGIVVRSKREGPLDFVGIDLLGSDSTSVLWLETPKGVPFMQVGPVFVFLWHYSEDDTWQAGWMHQNGRGAFIGDHRGPLAVAVALAEDFVVEHEQPLPRRTAAWRRNQAPSDKQRNFARSLGIPDAEGKTRARLSDDITIALAARCLDRNR